jgi:hypothetical protein
LAKDGWVDVALSSEGIEKRTITPVMKAKSTRNRFENLSFASRP